MATRKVPEQYIYICDYCLKEHVTEHGGLPKSWWTLDSPRGKVAPDHFCSLQHLRAAVDMLDNAQDRVLPTPGEIRKCFACCLDKEWGVFDPSSGAVICKDCRDARDKKVTKP